MFDGAPLFLVEDHGHMLADGASGIGVEVGEGVLVLCLEAVQDCLEDGVGVVGEAPLGVAHCMDGTSPCVFQDAADCKVFVQPIFSLFSGQNPDICTPTQNHDPSTVLDSVGISGSGISVVLHSWCFHHFLYKKTEFGAATASPEIARADPEIVDF